VYVPISLSVIGKTSHSPETVAMAVAVRQGVPGREEIPTGFWRLMGKGEEV
jgi:hypothetical protein